MDTLFEYLYVDHKRLNSYFEQISKSPVAYDKVPSWEGEAGITKLGGKYKGTVHPREFTTHEKVSRLFEHLEKINEINAFNLDELPLSKLEELFSRHVGAGEGPSYKFHFARLKAQKVIIRPAEYDKDSKGICLWISENSIPEIGIACWYLIQDFKGEDNSIDPHLWWRYYPSGFTQLQFFWIMLEHHQWQIDKNSAEAIEVSKITESARSIISPDPLEIEFIDDSITPKLLQEKLGERVIVSQSRQIETLYRCRQAAYTWPNVSIMAYPIFIVEAE